MLGRPDFESELRRIRSGPQPYESIPGIGTVRFLAIYNGDSARVLQKAKSVLEVVVDQCVDGWNSDAPWGEMLPASFVESCDVEPTRVESDAWIKRWQSLSDEERSQESKNNNWTLKGWLYWFQPSERAWLWWDAKSIDLSHIGIAVAVDSWPFPWGSLEWLFRGNGAVEVRAED